MAWQQNPIASYLFLFLDPTLSTARAFLRNRNCFFFYFVLHQARGTRRNAVKHLAGPRSSTTSRLTAPSPASSPQELRGPTSSSQHSPRRAAEAPEHPTAQDGAPRDYKPQKAVRESHRIPPRLERLPEPSASRQSLAMEQNRPVGEGRAGRRGRGRRRLRGDPEVRSPPPPPPPFRRGLLRARPRRRPLPGRCAPTRAPSSNPAPARR